eukprot:TRINITY_DN3156_c0_g1_i5.p1 TRINITY_DN3156_c0_g1~~TRINITY_DN3156_c0_g1_i5.p1  ORF type:complete len:119 (-),score=7.83 TRINITY_DN3156_c0_g1_i5:157-513(-)
MNTVPSSDQIQRGGLLQLKPKTIHCAFLQLIVGFKIRNQTFNVCQMSQCITSIRFYLLKNGFFRLGIILAQSKKDESQVINVLSHLCEVFLNYETSYEQGEKSKLTFFEVLNLLIKYL